MSARDEIYEYIIFRGSDIKDIRVLQTPKPHPTLVGGLPNDPAIVQHSAVGGSQKSTPIATNGSPPDPPFQSGSLPAQTSPVVNMLNQNSNQSSTSQAPSTTVNSNPHTRFMDEHNSRRSRGSSNGPNGGTSNGFYRADRGRGSNQGGFRSRGRGRGAFQPGRPTANPQKEPLTFDGEYDFDKGNDEFKEVLEKLRKSTLDSNNGNGAVAEAADVEVPEEGHDEPAENIVESSSSPVPSPFYDKKKSFFDTISSVANENFNNEQQPRARDYRNSEFKLNKETFGVAGNRGGRGGYYNRRGYNRGGQGGGHYRGQGGQGGGQYRGQGGFGRGGRDFGRAGYNNQNGFRGMNDRFARDT